MTSLEINWMIDTYLANLKNLPPKKSGKDFIFESLPSIMTQNYYSKISSGFIIDMDDSPIFFAKQSKLISRDGLIFIPEIVEKISAFTPKSKVYIEELVFNQLEVKHRQYFSFFRIDSNEKNKLIPSASNTIYLTFIASELDLTSSEFEQKLIDLRHKYQDIANIEFKIYFDFLFNDEIILNKNLMIEIGALLNRYLGSFSIATTDEILSYAPLKNTFLYEMHSQLLIPDSYIKHRLLSRGATLINFRPNVNWSEYVELSPFHRICLR